MTSGKAEQHESCGIETIHCTISGTATVTATGGEAVGAISAGMEFVGDTSSLTVKDNASLTANGGNCTIIVDSFGILCNGRAITIDGGTVNAKGGECENGYSCGIKTVGDITISGAGTKVTAKGGAAKSTLRNSYGINCSAKTITINGGTVEAAGGTSADLDNGQSYGIFNYNNLTSTAGQIKVNGGTLTAIASEAAHTHALFPAPDTSNYTFESVNYAKITASEDSSGTPAVDYVAASNNDYKYIKIEPKMTAIITSNTYVKGSNTPLVVTVGHGTNLQPGEIQRLAFNNEFTPYINDTMYTKENTASVTVTLSPSFLNSLSAGNYTLHIELDGQAPVTADFKVVNPAPAGRANPSTGVSTDTAVSLVLASALFALGSAVIRKK